MILAARYLKSPSQVTYDKDFHWAELFGFALLGIFGGLYGALFNKANIAWSEANPSIAILLIA